jgi:hypothetical protein
MSAYQAKDSQILGRQLEVQQVLVTANLVAGTSDLASNLSINNSTLTATVITLNVNEPILKCYRVSIVDIATGSAVAVTAAPAVSGNTISITVNGTGHTSCALAFHYSVTQY